MSHPFSISHKIRTILILLLACGFLTASTQAGAKSWRKKSGNWSWNNFSSWLDELENGGVPDDDDTATVEDSRLTISDARSIGYLDLNGGDLWGFLNALSDSLELRGGSNHSKWRNGAIRKLRLYIKSGAYLDVENTVTNDFTGSVLDNSGTLTWTNGNLTTDSEGGITNQVGALFADQTAGSVSIGSSDATFNNYGTYEKTGPGTTTVSQVFNNYSSETLEISDGIIRDFGGRHQHRRRGDTSDRLRADQVHRRLHDR